jgi:hypothetical protein
MLADTRLAAVEQAVVCAPLAALAYTPIRDLLTRAYACTHVGVDTSPTSDYAAPNSLECLASSVGAATVHGACILALALLAACTLLRRDIEQPNQR